MQINFRNFSYQIINRNQLSPQTVQRNEFPQKGIIDYEFKPEQHIKGTQITVTSFILTPLGQQGMFLLHQGSTTFLIPAEQPIETKSDPYTGFDKAVEAEFLFYHLSRQSAIIWVHTLNAKLPAGGYEIEVPTLYRLYRDVSKS